MRLTASRTRGFTLVELVTTIVLVGIMAAIAIPRLSGENVFDERGYADEVANALRYARKIAIATQCEVRLVVRTANYSTSQHDDEASCNNPSAGWGTNVLRLDGSMASGTAPSGTSAVAEVTVTFTEKGVVRHPHEPISIGPFTIDVDQLTGRVTVTP